MEQDSHPYGIMSASAYVFALEKSDKKSRNILPRLAQRLSLTATGLLLGQHDDNDDDNNDDAYSFYR